MKAIKLNNIILFVDDIISIYTNSYEIPNSYHEIKYEYYVETIHNKYSISLEDYNKLNDYLLSLNEPILEEPPKEDKKIDKIDLEEIIKNREAGVSNDTYLACFINEIIDRLNGE